MWCVTVSKWMWNIDLVVDEKRSELFDFLLIGNCDFEPSYVMQANLSSEIRTGAHNCQTMGDGYLGFLEVQIDLLYW